jgi:type II secretory pathway pseudopilin PulG
MRSNSAGFSLLEVIFALGILTVAVLGLAGVMVAGLGQLNGSPSTVIAAQKAAQAVEAVFAARDSHALTWEQVRNVHGDSGNDGGVFLDGSRPLTLAGSDGLVNTADDPDPTETMLLPGPDNQIGTADDRTIVLDGFTREIAIRDVPGQSGNLRSITVTITFPSGARHETYTLTTYISAYA